MLNVRFKSVVAASLATLSATAASIALAQMTPLDTIVAIVDEDIILASEVRDRVKQVKSSAEQRDIALPDDDTVVQETLDRLILESIQLQLADRFGVRIPDAQLDQSMARIAAQNGLTLDQMDVIEINEAFAAQSLAVMRELGLADNDPRVNPNGGAIALGHPLGMSGARLVTTAMYQLQRTAGRYALCTMCIGVGQGIALIIERCD